jgi:hypothetical protein
LISVVLRAVAPYAAGRPAFPYMNHYGFNIHGQPLPGRTSRREEQYTPTVRRLLGILPPETDIAEYHRHLEEKYGL